MTKTDLETLDYAYYGEPFVNVTSSSSLTDNTSLNYAYYGEPFYFLTANGGGGGVNGAIVSGIRYRMGIGY